VESAGAQPLLEPSQHSDPGVQYWPLPQQAAPVGMQLGLQQTLPAPHV
jgi:hypothetical protein